jgi:hypothetical protein
MTDSAMFILSIVVSSGAALVQSEAATPQRAADSA